MSFSHIPKPVYREAFSKAPLACVDLVVEKNNQILLVKRKEEPCKGQWWLPGGRIGDEKWEEAVQRIAQRELGQHVNIHKKIGTYETHLSPGPFGMDHIKGNNTVFLVSPTQETIRLDATSSDYQWASKDTSFSLSPYIKKVFSDLE